MVIQNRGQPDKPEFPRLLICEGYEDSAFFSRLIEERNLPRFHIWHAGGNGNFLNALKSYQSNRPRTLKAAKSILFVGDNDEDGKKNFQNIRTQIERYFGTGTAPTAPQEKTTGNPSLSILMIPWTNENGHLERLCVTAAKDSSRNNIGSHTDTFLSLIKGDTWNNESRYGKAWLRSNLAARCAVDPFVSLGDVFTDNRHRDLIPVTHQSFNRIATFLSGF